MKEFQYVPKCQLCNTSPYEILIRMISYFRFHMNWFLFIGLQGHLDLRDYRNKTKLSNITNRQKNKVLKRNLVSSTLLSKLIQPNFISGLWNYIEEFQNIFQLFPCLFPKNILSSNLCALFKNRQKSLVNFTTFFQTNSFLTHCVCHPLFTIILRQSK